MFRAAVIKPGLEDHLKTYFPANAFGPADNLMNGRLRFVSF
jgi:hypothetical protein